MTNRKYVDHFHRTRVAFKEILLLLYQSGRRYLFATLITAVLSQCLITISLYTAKLIVDGLTQQHELAQHLWLLIILEFFVITASYILNELSMLSRNFLGLELQQFLHLRITRHISELDMAFFDQPQNHDVMERAKNELGYRPMMVTSALLTLIESLTLITSLGALLLTSQPLLFLGLIIFSLPTLLIARSSGISMFELAQQITPDSRKAGYLDYLLTHFNNAKEIRLFGISQFLYSDLEEYNMRVMAERKKLGGQLFVRQTVAQAFAIASRYGAIAVAVLSTARGYITIGDFTLLVAAITAIQTALTQIMLQTGDILEGSLLFSDYVQLLNQKPQISNQVSPRNIPSTINQFTFKNVNFKYVEEQKAAVKYMDLHINANEITAIVGENGAGKSTFVKLLTRLYEPTEGKILLDGIDIRHFQVSDYRKLFSVVTQDFVHYYMTLKENITIGKLQEHNDTDRLMKSIKNAQIEGIINSLPNGLDSMLGRYFDENGKDLSGGEWQRVALARALYRDAPVLILDEPSSSLDPKVEARLFELYQTLMENKTVILITHRLNTVVFANRIIVFKDGLVVEDGTHARLMAKKGIYYELFTLQAQNYTN